MRDDDTGGATDAQLCGARGHLWWGWLSPSPWGSCYCGARLYAPNRHVAWTVFDWDDETTWPDDDVPGESVELLVAICRPEPHAYSGTPSVGVFRRTPNVEWERQGWEGGEVWGRDVLAELHRPDARIMWTTIPTPPEVPGA